MSNISHLIFRQAEAARQHYGNHGQHAQPEVQVGGGDAVVTQADEEETNDAEASISRPGSSR